MSESPTSRPCHVMGVKVVCGAQGAELTGGDHLQETNRQVQERKNVRGMRTEYGSNEERAFFRVPEKRGLEKLGGCGPEQSARRQHATENTCKLREGANRRDGSFARQRSTISLNAREYLCTPPSRSRVGGAPCTLSTDGTQIGIDTVGVCHRIDGTGPKGSRRGIIEFYARSLTSAKAHCERTPETAGHAPAPARGR